MKLKNIMKGLLFAALALILVACGPEIPDQSANENQEAGESAPAPEASGTDTLIMGSVNAPANINPFNMTVLQEKQAGRMMYETLMNHMGPTDFEPRIGNITTEDNQTFTVTVQEGIEWNDGTPLTINDVYYTLNTIAHPETLTSEASSLTMIEGVDEQGKLAEGEETISGLELVDDYTMTMTTKEPVDLNYIQEYIGFDILIVPEHVFSEIAPADIATSQPATRPEVTSGPFQYVDYQEENYLHLEANPNYWQGAPKLQNIYIRVLNGTSLVTELQSGNIHSVLSGGISHQDMEIVRGIEGLNVTTAPSMSIQYAFINTANERFQDPRVRQALVMAIDREQTIDTLLMGDGEVPASVYTSASGYYDESVEATPYDPEGARALLEEAGFDFSQPIVLSVPTGNTTRELNADLIQQAWENMGLTVTQDVTDFTTLSSSMSEGNYEIVLMGWAANWDPDHTSFLGTDQASNYMNYSNPRMDELLAEGRAGVTYEERYPAYSEIQQLITEDYPLIPLYSEYEQIIQSDRVVGGMQDFVNASFANVHEWDLTE